MPFLSLENGFTVLQTEQIRQADAYTITNKPISATDLMEQAASSFVYALLHLYSNQNSFDVVVGPGNNGGDGLVAARLLHRVGKQVRVFVLKFTEKHSAEWLNNKKCLPMGIPVTEVNQADALHLNANAIVIDAIFGTGLSRPATGLPGQVINVINQHSGPVVALDIPSGMFADAALPTDAAVVNAHTTITLQQPKLAFLLAPTGNLVGRLYVVDIGLLPQSLHPAHANHYLTGKKTLNQMLLPRNTFDHKGTYGHSLLVAGQHGQMGAAVLAARACVHSGTGLVSVAVPTVGYGIMQQALPEAMVLCPGGQDFITETPPPQRYKAVGLGPGLGQNPQTAKALNHFLKQTTTLPKVLDADALNLLAQNTHWWAFLEANTIITPHPGEFDRLTSASNNGFDRLAKAQLLAHHKQVIVLLKGAYTAICTPNGQVFFNPTGSNALATGGTGDVLTGLLTGLLAQGYAPLQAAQLGAWLHGKAAQLAEEQHGARFVAASNVIEQLGKAFFDLTVV